MSDGITRASYQVKRLEFITSILDPSMHRGLEIGACDLPTIPSYLGKCQFADMRSTEEMIRLWNLPSSSVAPVEYLLKRNKPLAEQINVRFDYVIACHVIEHVPNLIGYLRDLESLLDPKGACVIVLAAPDKRCTLDSGRPSTHLDHLLTDYHNNCVAPTVEHIMEFSRHWSPELRALEEKSLVDFYKWACEMQDSEDYDAHCHVWKDDEFITQMETLISGGILGNFSLAAIQHTPPGFNEFMVAFHCNLEAGSQ